MEQNSRESEWKPGCKCEKIGGHHGHSSSIMLRFGVWGGLVIPWRPDVLVSRYRAPHTTRAHRSAESSPRETRSCPRQRTGETSFETSILLELCVESSSLEMGSVETVLRRGLGYSFLRLPEILDGRICPA